MTRRDPLDGYEPGDDLDFVINGPLRPADNPGTVHVISKSAPAQLPRALRGTITDPRAIDIWHLMHGTVMTLCGRAVYRHKGRATDATGRFTDCFPDDAICWSCYAVLDRAGKGVLAFQHGYPLTLDQARGRLLNRPADNDPGNASIRPDWDGFPPADVAEATSRHPAGEPVDTAAYDGFLRELDRLGDARDGAGQ